MFKKQKNSTYIKSITVVCFSLLEFKSPRAPLIFKFVSKKKMFDILTFLELPGSLCECAHVLAHKCISYMNVFVYRQL